MGLGVHDKTTSATLNAVGQSLVLDVSDAASALIEIKTTALAGHNVIFEVSNDAVDGPIQGSWDGLSGTWRAIYGQRTNTPSTYESTSGVLSSTPAYAWLLSVAGWRYLRVRVTSHTSGSAAWAITASDAATTFAPIITSSVSLGTGTAQIGDVGGGVRATSGGLTTISQLITSAATTNATVAKTSAGRIYKIRGYNSASSVLYLKIYNKSSAPTVGTDTPVMILPLKPSDIFDLDFGLLGYYCTSGISYALTANPAANDSTAIGAGNITGLNIWYA